MSISGHTCLLIYTQKCIPMIINLNQCGQLAAFSTISVQIMLRFTQCQINIANMEIIANYAEHSSLIFL